MKRSTRFLVMSVIVVCICCGRAWAITEAQANTRPDDWRLMLGVAFTGTRLLTETGSLPLPDTSAVSLSLAWMTPDATLVGTVGTPNHAEVVVMRRLFSERGISGGDIGLQAGLFHDDDATGGQLEPGIGVVLGTITPDTLAASGSRVGWRASYARLRNGANLWGIAIDFATVARGKSETE